MCGGLDSRNVSLILFSLAFVVLIFNIIHFWTATIHDRQKDEIQISTKRNFDRLAHLKKICQTDFHDFKSEYCKNPQNKSILYSRNYTLLDDPLKLPIDCDNGKSQKLIWYRYDWLGDPNRNLAICMPPKTGCTTIQKFYQAVNEKDSRYLNFTEYDSNIEFFQQPSNQKDKDTFINQIENPKSIYKYTPRAKNVNRTREYLMVKGSDQYKRIINIRHPFERLYSGWRDKFNKLHQPAFSIFRKKYGEEILKFAKLDHDAQAKSESDHDSNMFCTFETFLNYIAASPFLELNTHFRPIAHFCAPCEIHFDAISETETLAKDLIDIFTDDQFHYKNDDGDYNIINEISKKRDQLLALKPYGKVSTAKKAFRNVNSRDSVLVRKIYEKYHWDFDLFGYRIDEYL